MWHFACACTLRVVTPAYPILEDYNILVCSVSLHDPAYELVLETSRLLLGGFEQTTSENTPVARHTHGLHAFNASVLDCLFKK